MSSTPEAGHEYDSGFYDYINSGSSRSAAVVCPRVVQWLAPGSLLDVGSGAGAWCRAWSAAGIPDVAAVDGDYVDAKSLLIDPSTFFPRDISTSFDMGRRFDLVTSLEVAEHIAQGKADVFVDNLVRHGDVVLFSAAVPGQGGEFHVNEQPLDYWREKFRARGYRCFDPLRPLIQGMRDVEPWYRYNTLLYVAAPRARSLPDSVLATEVAGGQPVADVSPLSWRLRNGLIRMMPDSARNLAVSVKHRVMRRKAH